MPAMKGYLVSDSGTVIECTFVGECGDEALIISSAVSNYIGQAANKFRWFVTIDAATHGAIDRLRDLFRKARREWEDAINLSRAIKVPDHHLESVEQTRKEYYSAKHELESATDHGPQIIRHRKS